MGRTSPADRYILHIHIYLHHRNLVSKNLLGARSYLVLLLIILSLMSQSLLSLQQFIPILTSSVTRHLLLLCSYSGDHISILDRVSCRLPESCLTLTWIIEKQVSAYSILPPSYCRLAIISPELHKSHENIVLEIEAIGLMMILSHPRQDPDLSRYISVKLSDSVHIQI